MDENEFNVLLFMLGIKHHGGIYNPRTNNITQYFQREPADNGFNEWSFITENYNLTDADREWIMEGIRGSLKFG